MSKSRSHKKKNSSNKKYDSKKYKNNHQNDQNDQDENQIDDMDRSIGNDEIDLMKRIHKKSTKNHKKYNSEQDEGSEIENNTDNDLEANNDNRQNDGDAPAENINNIKIGDKTKRRLKKKINEWLDCDDKIKELNAKTKKYKDAKKEQEDTIIKIITKFGMESNKIDVHDDDNNLRGRVYRHKSVTKGALKEDIIKDALMEAIRDEKKVSQLVKKIESKRPINERYYLKRTKGNKD